MILGSRSRCRRVYLAVFAVAVCVLTGIYAKAQTRTNAASSERSGFVQSV